MVLTDYLNDDDYDDETALEIGLQWIRDQRHQSQMERIQYCLAEGLVLSPTDSLIASDLLFILDIMVSRANENISA